MSVPVLGVVGVLTDGHKHLLALELCGGESFAAWNGCLDDLVARGLPALERKAPKHALAEIRDDFHRIVYATQCCCGPHGLHRLRAHMGQALPVRSANTIERLHEEFRRRVKTQGSLPSEDAAVVLLFSLVASGQIKLRKIDGWQKIAAVLNEQSPVAA